MFLTVSNADARNANNRTSWCMVGGQLNGGYANTLIAGSVALYNFCQQVSTVFFSFRRSLQFYDGQFEIIFKLPPGLIIYKERDQLNK